MKYELPASARADLAKVGDPRRALLRAAMAAFAKACGTHENPADIRFPAALRVKAVQGAAGVFEMTWSYASPDGRATFEWAEVTNDDGTSEPMVRWRRIGTHAIFKRP